MAWNVHSLDWKRALLRNSDSHAILADFLTPGWLREHIPNRTPRTMHKIAAIDEAVRRTSHCA